MLESETTLPPDISQLWLEKDMMLHQAKNLFSQTRGLDSELRALELVIQ
jgi:hypothetical protein